MTTLLKTEEIGSLYWHFFFCFLRGNGNDQPGIEIGYFYTIHRRGVRSPLPWLPAWWHATRARLGRWANSPSGNNPTWRFPKIMDFKDTFNVSVTGIVTQVQPPSI